MIFKKVCKKIEEWVRQRSFNIKFIKLKNYETVYNKKWKKKLKISKRFKSPTPSPWLRLWLKSNSILFI